MKQKIAFVISTPITARVFLAHQINTLSQIYDVTVIANMSDSQNVLDNLAADVRIISLPMERNIKPFRDLQALILLTRYFLQEKFVLIHSVTPKAGLIAAIAGYFARIPNRLHTFTGQVWATQTGFKRHIFVTLDKLIGYLATTVLVDSYSQRDFLIDNRVLKKSSSRVLNKGSISGVDLQRFSPSKTICESIRSELQIHQDAIILLFLGRLKIDKGVLDLANAFSSIYRNHPEAVLLFIGPDEEKLKLQIQEVCGSARSAIKFIPFTKRPEEYMAAADMFVLPSYREGFGSSVIEAAACEVPAVVSRIYGLTDAVEENKTGIFFQAGNVDEIYQAVNMLIEDKELRIKLGRNARRRVQNHFSQESVTNALCVLYNDLLNNNGVNVN